MATEVVLPMLGITVEKGTILKWLKSEGEAVRKGEILFEVETDKVTTEVESPGSGILERILIPEGVEVPVLTLVAVITEPGEELPQEYATVETGPSTEPGAAGGRLIQEAAAASSTASREVRAMPAARRLAREKGVDLTDLVATGPDDVIMLRDVEEAVSKRATAGPAKVSTLARRLAEREGIGLEGVEGTGVRGRIMQADVLRAVEGGKLRPPAAAPGFGQVIPMTTVRKTIASRVSQSAFTAPHIYLFTEVRMDELLALRDNILPEFEKRFGVRPSVNDFLIKAAALSILEFPLLNATLKGDEIHILPEINVGLAVAIAEGLIVPAIPRADQLGLGEIARMREDLVRRAHQGRLTLPELERGTFTVSSLAQYDISGFTAILNPPQSGILTVGRSRETPALEDAEIRVHRVCTFGLSVDHRIVDGAVAADFLQNFKWKLERASFSFLHL